MIVRQASNGRITQDKEFTMLKEMNLLLPKDEKYAIPIFVTGKKV
ncbi:hypothetical protein [Pseudolactococcus yaeyamensis]